MWHAYGQDRLHACMHARAIKSCHRDLWTAPRYARVHHTLKGGPGRGCTLCNVVVVEFKSGKFGWGNIVRRQGLLRLVHLCGTSTGLRHLSKINKLYLIFSVMQCPVSTHKILKSFWRCQAQGLTRRNLLPTDLTGWKHSLNLRWKCDEFICCIRDKTKRS